MDNHFKTVYRILTFLKKSEQYDEFDGESFTPEYFGLTARQWALTLERMTDDGHIKGVCIRRGVDGYASVSLLQPRITSKGLEYLEENSLMRKAANLAEGIAEIIVK
jgi:hypothetical protein